MAAALGGRYCRVLSGQRRPELTREQGLQFAVECIETCLSHEGGDLRVPAAVRDADDQF